MTFADSGNSCSVTGIQRLVCGIPALARQLCGTVRNNPYERGKLMTACEDGVAVLHGARFQRLNRYSGATSVTLIVAAGHALDSTQQRERLDPPAV